MIKFMKTQAVQKDPIGLFVLGALYPYVTGGMEIFNYYFLKHQVKEEQKEIYYLSINRIKEGEGNFILLKKIWPIRLIYPFQFFFIVRKLRKKIDYAYISFSEQSWIIPFSQSLTLRYFKVPYVTTIHWGKEPTWKFKYPFKQFFKKAHAVIGVSEPICKAYEKEFGIKNVFFVPPLIPFTLSGKTKSEAKTELGYNNEEKIILFVGCLKSMKNPHIILKALQQIEQEFLEALKIRVLFAGGGELLADLKSTTQKLQLTEYVRFDGLINRENIPTYYRAADCYIISSDYEGTSISLLEAMYNRLPIIAADSPGINSMVANNHTALLYLTSDANCLAKNIKKLFTDNTLAENIAEKAFLHYRNNYSYKSMIDCYNNFFYNTTRTCRND